MWVYLVNDFDILICLSLRSRRSNTVPRNVELCRDQKLTYRTRKLVLVDDLWGWWVLVCLLSRVSDLMGLYKGCLYWCLSRASNLVSTGDFCKWDQLIQELVDKYSGNSRTFRVVLRDGRFKPFPHEKPAIDHYLRSTVLSVSIRYASRSILLNRFDSPFLV
jgi:hypothetical protein